MKPRIVHIYSRALGRWFPQEESDQWYLSGWSGQVAQRTVEFTDRYEVENWRPDPYAAEVTTRQVAGVTCRVFPARTQRDLTIGPQIMWDCLQALRNQGPVIVHHSSIHHRRLYWILRNFPTIPVVAQHHGDPNPFNSYNTRPVHKRLLQLAMEIATLPRASHLLYLRQQEAAYLNRIAPRVPKTWATVGTESYSLRRDTMTRAEAKGELGLDTGTPMILYVGRFYRLKSVEHILETFRKLRRQRRVNLVLVGGAEADELFENVSRSGAHWRPFLPHERVLLYQRAADLYLSPFFVYGGFDVSVMEALSFGVPVISRLLNELPQPDRDHMGIPVTEPDALVPAVVAALDQPGRFVHCREAARRWFDWSSIIPRLIRVYSSLEP